MTTKRQSFPPAPLRVPAIVPARSMPVVTRAGHDPSSGDDAVFGWPRAEAGEVVMVVSMVGCVDAKLTAVANSSYQGVRKSTKDRCDEAFRHSIKATDFETDDVGKAAAEFDGLSRGADAEKQEPSNVQLRSGKPLRRRSSAESARIRGLPPAGSCWIHGPFLLGFSHPGPFIRLTDNS